ncbi:MAG: RluA family pseudouridine synthase [Proteobacteria bacterium]|nr:RluA family pseudouridine synthase [Pseudomonadota bacterium]
MSKVVTEQIADDENGIRLDRWFKRHYPALTHGRLEKLLRTGQVRVEGKRAKAGNRVEAGQNIRIPPQLANAPAEETPRSREATHKPDDAQLLQDAILYMDESVIVLNKPPGLATQGGTGQTRHVDGMLDTLMYGKKQRPRLVHRLDRDTSGVLVVGRTVPATAALGESLRRRDASKVYWALTRGVPKKKSGTIKLALTKEGGHGPHGRDERVIGAERDDEDAKYALTDYVVMGQAGEEFAWVAAKPLTGRTHQIRVHLASLGTPIVGDFKYGGAASRGKGAIADKLHLHARSIDIDNPGAGRLHVTAPLPAHMMKTWRLLGFDPDAPDPFETRRRVKNKARRKK